MRSSLLQIATEASVPKLEENHLPMPHILYGIIAMAVFLSLLGIVWTFRNTAAKQGAGAEGGTGH